MHLLHLILSDLGPYTAAVAVFAGWICYRANPLRATNRLLAAFLANLALWQVLVTLARTTHNVQFWGPLCMPPGLVMLFLVFLLHDALVDPYAGLLTRLKRSRLAWLTVCVFALGWILAIAQNKSPTLFPAWYRLADVFAFTAGLYDLRKMRRAARGVNQYETLVFQVTAFYTVAVLCVFELVRTPASSRINTALTFVYVVGMTVLLLSERVFDAGPTAKQSLVNIVRVALCALALFPVLELAGVLAPRDAIAGWVAAFGIGAALLPVMALVHRVTRRAFNPLPATEIAVRESALRILGTAQSVRDLTPAMEELAQAYLSGTAVQIDVRELGPEPAETGDPLTRLRSKTTRGWFSPDSAVRECRAAELREVLGAFAEVQLGAIVKCRGRSLGVFLYVGQRESGLRPITLAELKTLYDIGTITATAVERLRAVDDSFRAHGLAMVGRLAADFSFTARQQIATIQTFVEAVKDGREAHFSPAYRNAVYQETLALAANHNLALEITRLRPDKVAISSVELKPLLESVADACRRLCNAPAEQIEISESTAGVMIHADERLLRQVMLNLLRNALQACEEQEEAPRVAVSASIDGGVVHLDVVDNGPGVPAPIHDRLFAPWVTTKQNGTGLGLSFCLQAMRAIRGEITYLRDRGAPHAWFRVDVPLAAAARVASTGAVPVVTPQSGQPA